MPQGVYTGARCGVCLHPARIEIDRALSEGVEPVPALAARYGVSPRTMYRHRQHYQGDAAQARGPALGGRIEERPAPATPADARAQIADVVRRIDALLQAVEAQARVGNVAALRLSPTYYRELRETHRLLAEFDGRVATAGSVQVSIGSVWLDVRDIILEATDGYPEVRDRIAAAFIARGALRANAAGDVPAAAQVRPAGDVAGIGIAGPAPIRGGPQTTSDRPGSATPGPSPSPPGGALPSGSACDSAGAGDPGSISDHTAHDISGSGGDPYANDRAHLESIRRGLGGDPSSETCKTLRVLEIAGDWGQ